MAMAIASPASSAEGNSKVTTGSFTSWSLIGIFLAVAGYLGVFHGIPWLWTNFSDGNTGLLASVVGPFVSMLVGVFAVFIIWNKIVPPIPGVRAATVTGMASIAIGFVVIFLIGYILDALVGGLLGSARLMFGLAVLLALAFFWLKRFVYDQVYMPGYQKKMARIEDEGWFTTGTYKPGQGLVTRRVAMLIVPAIILIGVFGYWMAKGFSFSGVATWKIPFVSDLELILFRAPSVTFPLLLLGVAFWFGYRLVNTTRGGEYLINTQAEMGKVTWPTWKQLWNDTILVLVAIFLFAALLYALDILWTVVLKFIGVLRI